MSNSIEGIRSSLMGFLSSAVWKHKFEDLKSDSGLYTELERGDTDLRTFIAKYDPLSLFKLFSSSFNERFLFSCIDEASNGEIYPIPFIEVLMIHEMAFIFRLNTLESKHNDFLRRCAFSLCSYTYSEPLSRFVLSSRPEDLMSDMFLVDLGSDRRFLCDLMKNQKHKQLVTEIGQYFIRRRDKSSLNSLLDAMETVNNGNLEAFSAQFYDIFEDSHIISDILEQRPPSSMKPKKKRINVEEKKRFSTQQSFLDSSSDSNDVEEIKTQLNVEPKHPVMQSITQSVGSTQISTQEASSIEIEPIDEDYVLKHEFERVSKQSNIDETSSIQFLQTIHQRIFKLRSNNIPSCMEYIESAYLSNIEHTKMKEIVFHLLKLVLNPRPGLNPIAAAAVILRTKQLTPLVNYIFTYDAKSEIRCLIALHRAAKLSSTSIVSTNSRAKEQGSLFLDRRIMARLRWRALREGSKLPFWDSPPFANQFEHPYSWFLRYELETLDPPSRIQIFQNLGLVTLSNEQVGNVVLSTHDPTLPALDAICYFFPELQIGPRDIQSIRSTLSLFVFSDLWTDKVLFDPKVREYLKKCDLWVSNRLLFTLPQTDEAQYALIDMYPHAFSSIFINLDSLVTNTTLFTSARNFLSLKLVDKPTASASFISSLQFSLILRNRSILTLSTEWIHIGITLLLCEKRLQEAYQTISTFKNAFYLHRPHPIYKKFYLEVAWEEGVALLRSSCARSLLPLP